ncbi:hypothetical protein JW711_01975 [Candidatus Woesearchaeota archaeon]|nr:hypothetical protein [Candidatus Woesearchaeota archaeon]
MPYSVSSRMEDERLKGLLLAPDKREVLEELLYNYMRNLNRIQRWNHLSHLRFGADITRNGIDTDRILRKVFNQIDEFLEVEKVPEPTYYYDPDCLLKGAIFNLMNYSFRIPRKDRVHLILSASHEYTHHVQIAYKIQTEYYPIFSEGHARGVERHIAEEYLALEKNEAFLLPPLQRAVSDVKMTYIWFCAVNACEPRRSLLRSISPSDFSNQIFFDQYGEPRPHALGNALFMMNEEVSGKKIYPKAVKKKLVLK